MRIELTSGLSLREEVWQETMVGFGGSVEGFYWITDIAKEFILADIEQHPVPILSDQQLLDVSVQNYLSRRETVEIPVVKI